MNNTYDCKYQIYSVLYEIYKPEIKEEKVVKEEVKEEIKEEIKEKIVYRDRIVEKPVEKIVYRDRIVYRDNPVYVSTPITKKSTSFYTTSIRCYGSKRLDRYCGGYSIVTVPNYYIKTYASTGKFTNGYIYIAKSDFTNCVKIGYTGRAIHYRISELNGVNMSNRNRWRSTGAGTTFDWKYVYLIEANKQREDEDVHRFIKYNKPYAYSVQQGEMFKLTPEEALKIVLEYFNYEEHNDLTNNVHDWISGGPEDCNLPF